MTNVSFQPSERNSWQAVADATNNIVTPANAIDVAAFGLAMHGADRLDSWSGIAESGVSLIADLVDGKIARATGTASEIGEALDAGGDKIKLAKFILRVWQEERAPNSLLAAVTAQNLANVAITAYDRHHNETPQVHSSPDGKKAIFLQQVGLGMHVIGEKLSTKQERASGLFKRMGSIVGWAGVALGVKATVGYAKNAGANFKSDQFNAFMDVFDGVIAPDEVHDKYPSLAKVLK